MDSDDLKEPINPPLNQNNVTSSSRSQKPTQLRHNTSLKIESRNMGDNNDDILFQANINIERHALNVIVGPTGSGKSTLLKSMLGEMRPLITAQEKSCHEPIAYCAQEPWLENKTIHQNIVSVLPYDKDWYEKVKWACGLDVDVDQLDRRDGTSVGSQGINLSGGQKQRIVSVAGSLPVIECS
jgi:ABC-type bacteriocin/lantibiotic exporter with double-glycine peptidase domain